jgi:hypothetical protein
MSPEAKDKELAFFNAFGEGKSLTQADQAKLDAFEKEGMKQERFGLPLSYPVLKIVHQGNASFAYPEESGLPPVREFVGVIVHIDPARVWWKKSFSESGGGAMPDCFSRDLLRPDPACEDPVSKTCAACPNNQWGSDVKPDGSLGKGKACRETRRVFVIPSGHVVPYVMLLTPSNLKPLSKYLTSLGDAKVARPQMVATKFKSMNVPNADGVKYTEVAFEMVGKLSPASVLEILGFKQMIEGSVANAAPVTKEEVHG